MAIIPLQQYLKIASYTLKPSENQITTRSVSGQYHNAVRGPRLWQGTINCPPSTHAKAREIEGVLDSLMMVGNSFVLVLFDRDKAPLKPKNATPSDNFSAVRIDGAQSVGYQLRLRGLPPSFQLAAGDFLSFAIAGTHRLFRLTEPATANAGGDVTVSLNIGMDQGSLPIDGAVVTMVGPRVTCKYVNNSFSGINMNPTHADGFSFSFQQALFL